MPWNRKTSRRDRKRWSRLLRRNYRAEKRERAHQSLLDLSGFRPFRVVVRYTLPAKESVVYETYNPDDLPLETED